MKKARGFIKAFIFTELGMAVGKSMAAYSHYKKYPQFYETMSAPWYTQLIVSLLINAAIVIISVIVYIVLGKIIQKREAQENK